MKIEKKPLSIFRDVQWQINDDVCSQREVDHLLFSALQEELREKQEKNSIKDAFNFEVKRLKTLPEFSHLKMIDSNNTSVAVVVSSNIRFLLKKNFPTIRFSVKKNEL
ncbi:hypothetical protein [Serratia fonticola]|uniref:hypothetical protein n=1 Tax=Serratia fonticola TaxID=47917 RepID=UPI00164422B0|nr:hypothetical protein [Serratia fonticola]MBC3219690.1 hypothetical protein [Serratia fonticola]